MTASTALRMISILLVTILLGRASGPSSVGDFSILLAFCTILQSVSTGGLAAVGVRNLLKAGNRGADELSVLIAARLLLIPVAYILGLLGAVFFYGDRINFGFIIVFFVGHAIMSFDVAEMDGLSQGRFLPIGVSRVAVVLILAAPKLHAALEGDLLFVLLWQGVEAALWQVVLFANSRVTARVFVASLRKFREGMQQLREMRLLWVSGMAATLGQRIDLFIVAALLTSVDVGQYSTASRPVEAALIFALAVASVQFNDLVRASDDNSAYGGAARRASRTLLILGVICTIIVVAFGPWFIKTFYGDGFRPAADLIVVYAFSLCLIFQRQLLSKLLIIESRYGLSLWSNLVTFAVNATLNLILIPIYGLFGAAIAAVLGYVVSAVLGFGVTQTGRHLLILGWAAVLPRRIVDRAAVAQINLRKVSW